jgi:hypothetical protein
VVAERQNLFTRENALTKAQAISIKAQSITKPTTVQVQGPTIEKKKKKSAINTESIQVPFQIFDKNKEIRACSNCFLGFFYNRWYCRLYMLSLCT